MFPQALQLTHYNQEQKKMIQLKKSGSSTALLISACFASVFLFACAHKPAPGSAGTDSALGSRPDIQDHVDTAEEMGSDSGKIAGLDSIHFDYDSASLNADNRALAKKDVEWINSHPGVKVQIEGHCDRHGSTEYNLALGERRAKVVQHYFIDLGIPAARISIISYGKEKPLDSAETDAADQMNRRANFKPLGPAVKVSTSK
jgi:peptidoglycan-associated lipoprotein